VKITRSELKQVIKEELARTEIRTLPFKALIIEKGNPHYGIYAAYKNVREGNGSVTTGPLQVTWLRDEDKFLLTDGFHRLVEALLRGETEHLCEIDWSGFTTMWSVPKMNDRFSL